MRGETRLMQSNGQARRRSRSALALAIWTWGALVLFAMAPAAHAAAAIEGTWLTGNDSEITISRCGSGFCGRLTKIMVPMSEYVANRANIEKIGVQNIPDLRNKDPKLRTRRLLGIKVLSVDDAPPGGEFQGTIYNPQDGNTYSGRLGVVSRNKLRLTGCILFGRLCTGEDWVRVDRAVMPASCLSDQTRQFWLHCLGRD